ncbi:MAG: hypothetical protein GOVbin3264_19 [Prokaryotic dsDNA virus sp.]|nr:MAG: hypothetical protein GOVbin3264_19 [Prokaryotic dsDNA virus sp.]|tara:strand:+ start:925 stop:1662 length:738 start_codon:yes stop_codon:yes gene_type:complete
MNRIVIPSYKRSEVINEKTLKYLSKCNIPMNIIDVFVSDEEQKKEYELKSKYNVNYIIGGKNITEQRNIIHTYYPEGSLILSLDDDIEEMQIKKNKELIPFYNIEALSKIAKNEMIKNRTKICGIYPVSNQFFMKNKVSTNLKYIAAGFYYFISEPDRTLLVELEDKEDFERSIRYFIKYNSVVRLEMITMKTKFYKGDGGLQATRTEERITKSAKYLAAKYPEYCKMNTGKKTGHAEVRLINKI